MVHTLGKQIIVRVHQVAVEKKACSKYTHSVKKLNFILTHILIILCFVLLLLILRVPTIN